MFTSTTLSRTAATAAVKGLATREASVSVFTILSISEEESVPAACAERMAPAIITAASRTATKPMILLFFFIFICSFRIAAWIFFIMYSLS